MAGVRTPAVAGTFYPAQADQLETMVATFLDEARRHAPDQPVHVPKAIIAPHAGFIYSGPIAASAYIRLIEAKDRIRRVLLLGPAHRYKLDGLATTAADCFATPLGEVPVDREAVQELLTLPQVHELDAAHEGEHCLEVHLPFLQRTLADFQIVPLVIGQATHQQVAEVLEKLWGGPETLIVVSSDLSHYHDYDEARSLDQAASQAIERLDAGSLRTEQACGHVPIWGLIEAARHHGLVAQTVDLRSSGDTAGSRDQVVGYGAFVFEQDQEDSNEGSRLDQQRETVEHEPKNLALSREAQQTLLDVALGSIKMGIATGRPLVLDPREFGPLHCQPRATFVTLRISGELRGCVGTLEAVRPLVSDVAYNAYSAAFSDPRFPPLRPDELSPLDIHISILSRPEPVEFVDEADLLDKIRVGVDGLILEEGTRRGTLLPSLWEMISDPSEFLVHLKGKAGLAADYWSETIQVQRYTAESFG